MMVGASWSACKWFAVEMFHHAHFNVVATDDGANNSNEANVGLLVGNLCANPT